MQFPNHALMRRVRLTLALTLAAIAPMSCQAGTESHWFGTESHWFGTESHWYGTESHWYGIESHQDPEPTEGHRRAARPGDTIR